MINTISKVGNSQGVIFDAALMELAHLQTGDELNTALAARFRLCQRQSDMDIREVIAAVNQMQADGVIDRYAIGGAVGATFYLEPVATLDVVIFLAFRSEPGSLLVSPQPIFDYLKARGGTVEGEHIIIGGWPVQFLPPTGPLVEEALAQAVGADVEGTPARVLTAEHLAAIALQTGRAKDKARLLAFIEAGALDAARFQAILARHALVDAWRKFERQFLGDAP